MPEVFVASTEEIDEKLIQKFDRYEVRYIAVIEEKLKVMVESRISPFLTEIFMKVK